MPKWRHGHLSHEGQDEGFEEEGEAAAGSGPRDLHLLHPMLSASDPRHRRMQVGLVLEEVQVPPLLGGRVVGFAVLSAADRAGERPAGSEVDLFPAHGRGPGSDRSRRGCARRSAPAPRFAGEAEREGEGGQQGAQPVEAVLELFVDRWSGGSGPRGPFSHSSAPTICRP